MSKRMLIEEANENQEKQYAGSMLSVQMCVTSTQAVEEIVRVSEAWTTRNKGMVRQDCAASLQIFLRSATILRSHKRLVLLKIFSLSQC